MGGVPPSHHTCHFNSQLPVANTGGPPPHCTCHFSSQLPMANRGGSSFTSHRSLQLSTADGWWEVGGWILLNIAHVTSTLNFQWTMGVGGSSSKLHTSLQLLTFNGQWGWMGPPPNCTCHFNSQQPMAYWRPPPHCTCHFNSQLPNGQQGVGE